MNSIVLRKGKASDRDWIAGLLKRGSVDGHFGPTVGMQGASLVDSIVKYGGFAMLKLRNGMATPCIVPATLDVADIDGVPASFLVCIHDEDGAELHLAATRKEFQRKGGFRTLLTNATKTAPPGTRLFGRCYRKSTWAVGTLLSMGFKISKDGDPQELSLVAP